ncbi:MAG: hypothetical protein SXG53_27565 [Pseudomonadota bacterium]|nr:hypothetical protein [Pseudomonadota bacterium]
MGLQFYGNKYASLEIVVSAKDAGKPGLRIDIVQLGVLGGADQNL